MDNNSSVLKHSIISIFFSTLTVIRVREPSSDATIVTGTPGAIVAILGKQHLLFRLERRMRRRQSRNRHSVRRTADIVHSELVAKLDGRRLSPVLPADPDLEIGFGLPAEFDRDLHQFADPRLVEFLKRVGRINLVFDIVRQKTAGVVAR